jgi:hypothetical protein
MALYIRYMILARWYLWSPPECSHIISKEMKATNKTKFFLDNLRWYLSVMQTNLLRLLDSTTVLREQWSIASDVRAIFVSEE